MSDTRKRLVDRVQFNLAKKIRRLILGPICECCQKKQAVLGHHTKSKECNGVLDISLRCSRCETVSHQQKRDGNPPWAARIHEINNRIVLRHLGL